MVFKKKKLNKQKRVCSRLREARLAAGLSVEDVATKTRLRPSYVRALEECHFNDIPYAVIYQKNFVRRYAAAVGLPTTALLEQFTQEETPPTQTKVLLRRRLPTRFSNLPLILRIATVSIIILSLVSYLGWQVHSIVTPPTLTIYSPPDGLITNHPELLINGLTVSEARVFINGQEITTDGAGRFAENINLSPGINTIIISAKKRHGKISRLTRHIILKSAERLTVKGGRG